uniref:DNA helicase n=1 Tax=Angiostrongylus costaricensis TaxID=334426 RepID=A0A0R3PYN4_ANGCS
LHYSFLGTPYNFVRGGEVTEREPAESTAYDFSTPFSKARKRRRFQLAVDSSDFERMPICGVDVRVPSGLKLYSSQKLMMVRIITALTKKLNLLAESPTGTGKTLALLTSSCAWLDDDKRKRWEALKSCPIHGKYGDTDGGIKPGIGLPLARLPDGNAGLLNLRGPAMGMNPFAVYRTSISTENSERRKCSCLPKTRIYYGTRTHKQISQVVKEFSRLPYGGVLSHTILASREQSCVNKAARESQDVSSYCKELISSAYSELMGCCRHKDAMKRRFENARNVRRILQKMGAETFNIEELVSCLSSMPYPICPYFASTRVLTQDAEIIFCPFSYLIDPVIRNSSDVHLKNSVVILDEAHNIEDICREAASFTFFEKELLDALSNLRENGVFSAFTKSYDKISSAAVTCVEKWLYFIHFFKEEEKRSMYKLVLRLFHILNQRSSFRMGGSRIGQTQTALRNVDYSHSTGEGELWPSSAHGSNECDPVKPGFRTCIGLWCMGPELAFNSAFMNCRSVILASGTLCPVETLKTELGFKFHSQVSHIVFLNLDGSISVPSNWDGCSFLCATFRNYGDENSQFISELALVIRYSICMLVPKGILCFFPSYRMLAMVYDFMERTSILRQVQFRKVVVKEPRRSSDLHMVMEEYESAVSNPALHGEKVDGGLMLAVFRGKVSEGLDFSDDLARVVIAVGIPFPNAFDELVKEKKNYNDLHCRTKSLLSGEQWYVSQAYRAINQALGRCLRHKDDWGALVLVDERLVGQASKADRSQCSRYGTGSLCFLSFSWRCFYAFILYT